MEEMVEKLGFITHLKTYIIGSIALSILGAVISGFLGYIIFASFNRKKIAINDG